MNSYSAVEFFDRGFGPRMVSVTPVMGDISPSSKLHPKSMGKAPGVLTPSGWTSLDVNNVKFRCHDYATAKLWCEDWGANTGFAVGDGYVVFDNDEGREFSLVLRGLLSNAPRRFVQDPKHERDAFFVRVLDFVGDGAAIPNAELTFRNGVRSAKLSILAKGKQSVIGGTHPGTRAPYCWDRDIADIADIPVMSEEMFDLTVKKFIKELGSRGWKLDGPPPRPVSGVSAAPVAIATGVPKSGTIAGISSARFAQARDLLAMIPNRDIPPNITPSPADIWLDDYGGWIEAAYMLAAFLEDDVLDPEAEEIWCEWSNGKTQVKQSSLDLWRSVRNQPLRFQPLALPKKVQELTQGEPDFPDIDPNDPAMKVAPTPVLDAMLARWAYCPSQDRFIDIIDKSVIKPDAFARDHTNIGGVLKQELHYPGRGRKSVSEMFLSLKRGMRVSGITYAPGDPIMLDEGKAYPVLNDWRPTTAQRQAVTDAQIKPWLDHLLFVLGSPSERERFLKWCAFVINHPREKPNWQYLVMSDQGYGKDSMTAPIKLAVGEGNCCDILSDAATKDFGYILENKLIIVGETGETRLSSAHELAKALKPLASAPPPTVRINKKFLAEYQIPNRCAMLLFSNESNPLQLEVNQRRFHVLDRMHLPPKTKDYYEQLYDWLDNGGAALAASYLLNIVLTPAEQCEFKGRAPESSDKTALEQMNLPSQQAALEDIIEDARAGIRENVPTELVATVHELCQMIRERGSRQPSSREVGAWLLAMERAKRGVRRYRIDPKNPERGCGVADAQGYKSGRLWLLADKTADGRDWDRLPTAEVLALWLNMPAPKSASVTRFPSKAFPDDGVV